MLGPKRVGEAHGATTIEIVKEILEEWEFVGTKMVITMVRGEKYVPTEPPLPEGNWTSGARRVVELENRIRKLDL